MGDERIIGLVSAEILIHNDLLCEIEVTIFDILWGILSFISLIWQ